MKVKYVYIRRKRYLFSSDRSSRWAGVCCLYLYGTKLSNVVLVFNLHLSASNLQALEFGKSEIKIFHLVGGQQKSGGLKAEENSTTAS